MASEVLKVKTKRLSKRLNLSELDAACSEGEVEAVKALLALNNKEAAGTPDKEDVYFTAYLPIHTACQQRRKAPREVIEVILKSGNYSITDKTVNGDTALHVACTSGNLQAVEALLNCSQLTNFQECLEHQNRDGNTPFHLASLAANPDITLLLLKQLSIESTQVINRINKQGESCLGLAIKNKDWNSAKFLLRHSCNNPAIFYPDFIQTVPECSLIENIQSFECDPIDVVVLGDSKSGKTTLINTLQHSTLSTLSKLATLFGSRTITEMCRIGIFPVTVAYRNQVHRCPVTFHDVNGHRNYTQEAIFKCIRNPLEALFIITVDTQRNYVEQNILYWLSFLYHQLSDYSHCIRQSSTKTGKMKLKVVITGTFFDLVCNSNTPAKSGNYFSSIVSLNEELASNFIWCGDFRINARKHNLFDMPQVLSAINDQCKYVHKDCLDDETKSLLPQTYILASLLLKEFSNTDITTFSDVIGLVKYTESRLCEMLPKEDAEIEKLCQNLRLFNNFKILRFETQNKRVDNQYIIFNYKYLLQSIECVLMDLSAHTVNGIASRQQITDDFKYRQFIMKFLDHFKLCEYINRKGLEYMKTGVRTSRRSRTSNCSQRSTVNRPKMQLLLPVCRQHRRTKSDSEMIDIDELQTNREISSSTQLPSFDKGEVWDDTTYEFGNRKSLSVCRLPSKQASGDSSTRSSKKSSKQSAGSYKKEVPYYYLPLLVPKNQPAELWDIPEGGNSEYTYGFAWSLIPHKEDTWFLMPRFSTIVLFRLLFSFAPHNPDSKSHLDRMCTLWDRGILWTDPQGARVCVAINDDNKITLSMQCYQKYEIACLSIRNEIMADIKQQLKEIHPEIKPRELFIPYNGINVFPVIDPLESYIAFDRVEIRQAIAQERPAICISGRHHKEIDSLLHFEPLCFLQPPLLKELFNTENDKRQISDDFCMQLAKNLSTKWTHLAQHLEMVLKKYYIDALVEDSTPKAPHDTAMEMLAHLKEIDYQEGDRVDTFYGFRKSLFEISIFTQDEVIKDV